VAFDSTVLASLGVDDTELERMLANKPPSDASLAAVYELARSILLHRGKVDDVAVSRATAAGVTSQEILEIVAASTDIVPRRASAVIDDNREAGEEGDREQEHPPPAEDVAELPRCDDEGAGDETEGLERPS
jgi:hypothetical protein